jgi:hypothetical protein
MGYLIRNDYKSLIQTDNLSQIIGADYQLLTKAELQAESELKSYLVQKYDTDKEFTDTTQFAYASTYAGHDRVYLDATAYSTSLTYAINALVLYGGNVYQAINTIGTPEAFNAAKWALLGYQYQIYYLQPSQDDWNYYTEYVADDEVWFDGKVYTCVSANEGLQPDENVSEWGAGVADAYEGSGLLSGDSEWTSGDNRNQQMVAYMIDVVLYHLHSRIAPRNIPELRVKRYDDVIAWLKQCAKGDDITADLDKIQPFQGNRIRMGSRLEKQNNNF